ncbi:MAG: Ldh family oxidoreductase, partial [Anaerolineae bacterium]
MATNETSARISADRLRAFCTQVFQTLGVPEEDAFWTADVLVEADLRGVGSHGVARLKRYVDGLRTGVMVPRPQVQVVRETATTALVDGGGGLGQPVSVRAMRMARDQAGAYGTGFVAGRPAPH